MNLRGALLTGVATVFMSGSALAQTTTPVDPASLPAGVGEQAEPGAGAVAGVPEAVKPEDKKAAADIIVTGTRIVRPNMTSNAPITVIDESFLRERGLARVEDALSQIPQITPMLGLQGNGWTSGRANINLRRLGAGRSLILLNGNVLGLTWDPLKDLLV